MMDAPKTVKNAIMSNLPGYYLNNSENVEEPYFEEIHHGAFSEPAVISLKTGEGLTLSHYSYDANYY